MKVCLFFKGLFFILYPAFFLFSDPPSSTVTPKKDEEVIQEAPSTKEQFDQNIRVLVRGSNIVGFELYGLLKSSAGNLCFSPYSLASALSIPYTGAMSASQESMRIVMHYLAQPRQGNEVFQGLNKFYSTPWYLGSNECRLFLANSLWLQRDYSLMKDFSEGVNFFYPGGLRFVDFLRNPEGARYNMNTWIREKTHGRIAEEVQKEDVAGRPSMVLVSGAFLKSVWFYPFNPALSKEAPFFIDKQTTSSVNMMSLSGKFKIFRGPDVTLIELPYRGNGNKTGPEFALVIILPIANFGLASIEEKFYNDNWVSWLAGMREEVCIVTLPKFTIQQTFDLAPLLSSMGMQNIFSDQADFSGISAKSGLVLKKFLHGAYFSIDEKGSDAVVANPLAVTDRTAGFPEGALVFKADHPFLYVVMDKIKGTIIYLGRYSSPDQIKVSPKE